MAKVVRGFFFCACAVVRLLYMQVNNSWIPNSLILNGRWRLSVVKTGRNEFLGDAFDPLKSKSSNAADHCGKFKMKNYYSLLKYIELKILRRNCEDHATILTIWYYLLVQGLLLDWRWIEIIHIGFVSLTDR